MLRSIIVFGLGAAGGVVLGSKIDDAVADKITKSATGRSFQRTAFQAGTAAGVIMLVSRIA